MSKKQLLKIFILNLVLVIINIILFSEGILGFSISSDNAIIAALSVTVMGMSLVIFFYGNFKLIKSLYTKSSYIMDDLDTQKEYVEALESYRSKVVFSDNIDFICSQMERVERKKSSLEKVLYQKYKEGGDEFTSLKFVVEDTSRLLFENIKKILSRMEIFDYKEYEKIRTYNNNSELDYARTQLFKEHLMYVKKYIDKNEEILLQFDNLLIEVSKIGDREEDSNGLENLECIISSMKNLRSGDNGMKDLESKYS